MQFGQWPSKIPRSRALGKGRPKLVCYKFECIVNDNRTGELINPITPSQFCTLSQWFLTLLSNQACATELTAQACFGNPGLVFGRKFKNHWLLTRFICILLLLLPISVMALYFFRMIALDNLVSLIGLLCFQTVWIKCYGFVYLFWTELSYVPPNPNSRSLIAKVATFQFTTVHKQQQQQQQQLYNHGRCQKTLPRSCWVYTKYIFYTIHENCVLFIHKWEY